MKIASIISNATFYAGILMTFPAFFFVLVSVLKFTFGLDYLYDAFVQVFEGFGSKESLGVNVNAVIVFGPLVALLINLSVVLRMQIIPTDYYIEVQITSVKNRKNWGLVMFSGLLLSVLIIYMLAENCNC